MKLPLIHSILIVDDFWTPDSECPDEVLLRAANGDTWSVSVRAFNYVEKISDANKKVEVCKKLMEGEDA